jgi:hypothetical protein
VVTLTLPLSLGKGRGDRRSGSRSGNSSDTNQERRKIESGSARRGEPMTADPTQRVEDNAFHLPAFLSS